MKLIPVGTPIKFRVTIREGKTMIARKGQRGTIEGANVGWNHGMPGFWAWVRRDGWGVKDLFLVRRREFKIAK